MKHFLFLAFALAWTSHIQGQGVKISASGGNPVPSAILEVESTSQGMLPPRLTTTQRDAISNPSAGLRIYNTDTGCENFYSGVTQRWMAVCGTCAPPAPGEGVHQSTSSSIQWNWNPVPGATRYYRGSSSDFSQAQDMGTATTYTQTGVWYGWPPNNINTYTLYVWAYNEACGHSDTPAVYTAQPCSGGLQPNLDAAVPSSNQILWAWNGSAEGYKWNTVDDYSTATDVQGATTLLQTGLSPGTSYTIYVWGYESTPGCVSSTLTMTESTVSGGSCTVGSIGPGGGYVFYCGNAYPGKVGLEAAPTDISSGAQWGCYGSDLPGAGTYEIGGGVQNTLDIVNNCGTAGIAARLCNDSGESGYTDWFLPSFQELHRIWWNLRFFPGVLRTGSNETGWSQGSAGFQLGNWNWSSTENTNWQPWNNAELFGVAEGGGVSGPRKYDNHPVRCIRAF